MENNIAVKEYPIVLGGEKYNLRYDFSTMEYMEEKYGNLGSLYTEAEKDPFKAIPKFIHAAILHEKPDVDISTLKKQLPGDLESILNLQEIVCIMVLGSIPKSDKKDGNEEESEEKNEMTNPTE